MLTLLFTWQVITVLVLVIPFLVFSLGAMQKWVPCRSGYKLPSKCNSRPVEPRVAVLSPVHNNSLPPTCLACLVLEKEKMEEVV